MRRRNAQESISWSHCHRFSVITSGAQSFLNNRQIWVRSIWKTCICETISSIYTRSSQSGRSIEQNIFTSARAVVYPFKHIYSLPLVHCSIARRRAVQDLFFFKASYKTKWKCMFFLLPETWLCFSISYNCETWYNCILPSFISITVRRKVVWMFSLFGEVKTQFIGFILT